MIVLLLLIAALISGLNHPAPAAAGSPPERVVSLAPSVTETVFALGLGHKLVAVTNHCDYPAAAQKLPKTGGFTTPSLEAVLAARPDHVLGVSTATDPVKAREMRRLGLPVTLFSVGSVNDIFNSIKGIARLLGKPAAGEDLVQKIFLQIDGVKKRVAGRRPRSTLVAVGLRPLVAVGGRNFIDELITLAGGKNIAGGAAQPWLNLPYEYVVAKAPEVIIEAGAESPGASSKNWADLNSIPAVRERRVYAYRSDKMLRPGPRIGEGVEEIARLLHPECFAPSNTAHAKGRPCEGSRP
jgi:iron complex transport system substrate-binding protein